ncbi:MAG: hypothetical protein MRY72_03280 [Aquisalinus sp.]|nr:hypothetical protein [Aquisalinus sp.]
MYDADIAPTEGAAEPFDASPYNAPYPADEETRPWRQRNLAAETDRENYISCSDPLRSMREATGHTLSRIEYSELMLDRLSRQVMGLCSEQLLLEEKLVKQVLDKTRMTTSIIRGYQHLFTMREELMTRCQMLHERDEAAGATFDRLQAAREAERITPAEDPQAEEKILKPWTILLKPSLPA